MKSVPPPNYTQAPNVFFDELLAQIDSLAELKVTLAIIRQTFGYHKKESELSVTRLEELTGLSRRAVFDGLRLALERGHVRRKESGQSYLYHLNIEPQLVQDLHQSQSCTSAKSAPEVVQEVARQVVQDLHPPNKDKETKKETVKEKPATPTAPRGGARAPAAPKPHKRDERSRDPRTNHPAIKLLKSLTGYNPKFILYDRVIEALGTHPDYGRAKECATEWAARGYRMDNHAWVFEWYAGGIPPRNGARAPTAGKPGNVERSVQAVKDFIAEKRGETPCQPNRIPITK